MRALNRRRAGWLPAAEFDFDTHFWVRYRNAASAIERFTIVFAEGLSPPLTEDNRQACDRMRSGQADGLLYGFTEAQALEALVRLPQARIVPIFQPGRP